LAECYIKQQKWQDEKTLHYETGKETTQAVSIKEFKEREVVVYAR
jgi:hypothetical protein